MLREKLSFRLFCKLGSVLLLFTCCFLAGQYAGKYTKEKAEETTSSAFSGSGTAPASENWGLSFPKEGASPQANATPEELSASWAYYIGNPKEKVLYLTFDCGFENGNTPAILKALKKPTLQPPFSSSETFWKPAPISSDRCEKTVISLATIPSITRICQKFPPKKHLPKSSLM